MGFGDIIGLVFGGGATGLIGSAVNRYFDLQKAKQDMELAKITFAHEIESKQVDFQIMQVEWDGRNKIAVTEADGRSDVADSQAFAASFSTDKATYSNTSKLTTAQNSWMIFVDGIRGLIRPGLTAYLSAVSTAIWMQQGALLKLQPIPVDAAVNIYQQSTAMILFLTSTCVTWWFGSRTKSQTKK